MESPPIPEYQHAGFYFSVTFSGLDITDIRALDSRFQSVSGLEAQIDMEAIKEGGENSFTHNLPGRRSYSALVLKRGIIGPNGGSQLTKWCQDAFKNLIVKPINLEVALLCPDEAGEAQTLFMWKVLHAWPKSWKIGELNAERGEVLIETLELNYNRFEFVEGSKK